MQDLLGLGSEARMNIPSTSYGNWQWRAVESDFSPDLAKRLLSITKLYGR
jgi:4-alpha-glucanotransferase